MLKQRVITAVLLLSVLIPSLFSSSAYPFGFVSVGLIACAAWEWSKLNGFSAQASLLHGCSCALTCGVMWLGGLLTANLSVIWLVAGAFWVLAGAWLLHSGSARWQSLPRYFRLIVGIAVLIVAWLALMQLRRMGVYFLLSVLFLVWVADICAYFAGRALGGKWITRKLAPSISPGKTWEGALGGAIGVLVLALGWFLWDKRVASASPGIYTSFASRGYIFLAVSALFLTAMSVVGDLVESLFKRAAGVKDSSRLLPGHGGVLDRIDALLPTLPLAMMLSNLGAY
jgi:phosphatidate cytidylyltransferase